MLIFDLFDMNSLILLAFIGGGLAALIVTVFMWGGERVRLRRILRQSRQIVEELEEQIGFYEAWFNFNRQCLIVWNIDNNKNDRFWVSGMMPPELNGPQNHRQWLDFSHWLPNQAAQEISQALAIMEDEATSFSLKFDGGRGRLFQACGQRIGDHMMLTFSALSEDAQKYWQQKQRGDDMTARLATLQMLLDEFKQPVWMRDQDATISWGNRAYFRGADDHYELFPEAVLEKIRVAQIRNVPYSDRVSTIIDGDRRIFDVSVVHGASGSAGMAVDETQLARLHEEAEHTIAAYLAIFDDLPTAIAIFDTHQKLEFFNPSFAALWPLDVSFLETSPNHALLLEKLRESQILAENPDWRRWKEQLFEAYHALEPQLHIWNLADGRTLRVIAKANPQGGVTWLYEDLTEKLQLEARYNTLIRMQGETLDHLHEGVGLFGPDGRLLLANPAFGQFWGLPPHLVIEGVHIRQIEACCAPLCVPPHGAEDWQRLAAQITGFSDARQMVTARLERLDGRIANTMLVPLPQGQTMLSFIDVSDSVKVARALAERNEALESANQLRTDFVSHVSYELRTPLTNIIGFTDLLRTPAFGELNTRQSEYLDNIGAQSLELLNLVNDILDLATVDAGIMQLDIAEVDVAATMCTAATRIEEKLAAKQICLDMNFAANLPYLHADEARLRQILFNTLANAVNFAPNGSTIIFSAHSENSQMVFRVHDEGAGIPDDILDKVFERFYARAHGGIRPGAGLGLAIVKSFVDLHQGQVEIETGQGQGTTIICSFPLETPLMNTAAE